MNTDKMKMQAKIKSEEYATSVDVAKMVAYNESQNVKQKIAIDKFKETEKKLEKAASDLWDSVTKLSDASNEAVKSTKQICINAKKQVNEVKDQLVKVDNLVGNHIEPKILQLERAAIALKTIHEMSSNPKVYEMLKSLK
jgi:hypothetical protein